MTNFYLCLLGCVTGALSGLLGVGGGVIVIPALCLIFGFSQKTAQGTSLAMMIPPIGIFAVMNYHKSANVDWKAAVLLAIFFAVGSFGTSSFIPKIPQDVLRKIFAMFLLFTAGYFLFAPGGSLTMWGSGGTAAFFGGGWLRRRFSSKSAASPKSGNAAK